MLSKKIGFIKSGLGNTSSLLKRGFATVDTTSKKLNKLSGGVLGKVVEYSPALSSLSNIYKDVRSVGLAAADIMEKRPQQIANVAGVGEEYKKAAQLLELGKKAKQDIQMGDYKSAISDVKQGVRLGEEIGKSVLPKAQAVAPRVQEAYKKIYKF